MKRRAFLFGMLGAAAAPVIPAISGPAALPVVAPLVTPDFPIWRHKVIVTSRAEVWNDDWGVRLGENIRDTADRIRYEAITGRRP